MKIREHTLRDYQFSIINYQLKKMYKLKEIADKVYYVGVNDG